MRSRRGAAGRPRDAGCGGGRTASTAASCAAFATSIARAERDDHGGRHAAVHVARQYLRAVDGALHGVVPFLEPARLHQALAHDRAVGRELQLHLGQRIALGQVGEEDVRLDARLDAPRVARRRSGGALRRAGGRRVTGGTRLGHQALQVLLARLLGGREALLLFLLLALVGLVLLALLGDALGFFLALLLGELLDLLAPAPLGLFALGLLDRDLRVGLRLGFLRRGRGRCGLGLRL